MTMMSASSSAPDFSLMPCSVNVSMWSVDDRRRPRAKRLVEVAVGDDAEALVPRVVGRLEVDVDRDVGRQVRVVDPADDAAHEAAGSGGRAQ